MRTITIFAAALALAATITASAMAADPLLPFPSAKAGPVFISSHVITTDGALASWFQPGAKVEFRAFAIDTKTKKMVQAKDVHVLLRDDPEPAEREAQVRRRRLHDEEHAVDGDVDGAGDISASAKSRSRS